jgi:hypothetical protein
MAAAEELSDDLKHFIVGQLATWATPSEVVATVKADFGIEISRQRVECYDPTKVAGKALSPELTALFEKARTLYLADTAAIGIAQQTYRLRLLERLATRAEAVGNMGMAAMLAEQAAKEMGGAYTNRRELSGPGGKPIQTQDLTPQTPKEVADELAGIFGGGLANSGAAARAAPGPAGDDPVVHAGPDRSGGEVTRASAPGQAQAQPQRPVLSADGDVQAS